MNRDTGGLTFTYLVPCHNEAAVLESTTEQLCRFLARFPGSRILLLENGSTDGTKELVRKLAGQRNGVHIIPFVLDGKGMGLAYRRGLEWLLEDGQETWAVLTAADLPFAFTDIEAFLAHDGPLSPERVAIGSKAHPESQIRRTPTRRLVSFAFWLARRALVGMRTRDCQGSIFLSTRTAHLLYPLLHADNFFLSTELVYFAEKKGIEVVELPVQLIEGTKPSSVRPFHHGQQMLRQLLELKASTPA